MAAGDITEGMRTPLADLTRLNNMPAGWARAFGQIDNGAINAPIVQNIHLTVPINSLATGGTYDLYLVESQDGAEWTDNTNPAVSNDVAARISDAKLLHVADTTYSATARTNVEFHVALNMLEYAQFIALVLLNNSGQEIPASGADGDSQSKTVS